MGPRAGAESGLDCATAAAGADSGCRCWPASPRRGLSLPSTTFGSPCSPLGFKVVPSGRPGLGRSHAESAREERKSRSSRARRPAGWAKTVWYPVPLPPKRRQDFRLGWHKPAGAGGLWLGFPVYAWKLFREIYFIPGVLLKAYIYIYMLNKCLEKNAALPPSWTLLSKAQIQASSKKFPCEKLQIILVY